MPRSSNRKPRTKDLARLTEQQSLDALSIYRRELYKMRKEGIFTGNPEEQHPLADLTRLLYHPNGDHIFKLLVLKELVPHVSAPKAAQLRLTELGQRDFNITIVVPRWAASKADEMREAETISVTASRTLEDGRNTKD